MDRERVLIWTSRLAAAAAGLTMIFAGWYLLMTVALGGPDGRSAALTTAVGIAWLVAGILSVAGDALLSAAGARAEARLDLVAALLVIASAPLVEAPLAFVPGVLMLTAAGGERLARRLARTRATFTVITSAGASVSPASRRRVA